MLFRSQEPEVITYDHAGRSTSTSEAMKVLRNTYMLLALTVTFSAVMSYVAMAMGVMPLNPFITFIAYFGLLFLVQFTAKSAWGILSAFALTGFLGFTIGPIVNFYLATEAGTSIVLTALAATAVAFFSLSGYVLITGKDMSFLGGILFAGVMVLLAASLLFFVLRMFGIDVTLFSLAISVVSALISCGYILFTTSRIIHGGEQNYILATVTLYVSLFNLFVSLLNILSAFRR